nr:hypothetical protein [Candidatus Pseudomonas adelgestsugas]
MNCLIEALNLALPGNGFILATHGRPQTSIFLQAGQSYCYVIHALLL